MFNDIGDNDTTILLVIICGLQEILIRSTMEWKEVNMRKLLGLKPLKEAELVTKRRFYSYIVTARSILEIVAIIVSPAMFIFFFPNRFAVDFGYSGVNLLNYDSIYVSTIIQVLIELLVIFICSMIEVKQNIPMSDFFYHYRSVYILICHYAGFMWASVFMIFIFKTVPSFFFCMDIQNPCSCASFKVYASLEVCRSSNATASSFKNGTVNFTQDGEAIYSTPIIIGIIAAVLLIFIATFLFVVTSSPLQTIP